VTATRTSAGPSAIAARLVGAAAQNGATRDGAVRGHGSVDFARFGDLQVCPRLHDLNSEPSIKCLWRSSYW
jgi:hypothetical protein